MTAQIPSGYELVERKPTTHSRPAYLVDDPVVFLDDPANPTEWSAGRFSEVLGDQLMTGSDFTRVYLVFSWLDLRNIDGFSLTAALTQYSDAPNGYPVSLRVHKLHYPRLPHGGHSKIPGNKHVTIDIGRGPGNKGLHYIRVELFTREFFGDDKLPDGDFYPSLGLSSIDQDPHQPIDRILAGGTYHNGARYDFNDLTVVRSGLGELKRSTYPVANVRLKPRP